ETLRDYCAGTNHVLPSFFFFSSRRRHTMFSRDWSSDVCSSDLVEGEQAGVPQVDQAGDEVLGHGVALDDRLHLPALDQRRPHLRSEERRVGKSVATAGSRSITKQIGGSD